MNFSLVHWCFLPNKLLSRTYGPNLEVERQLVGQTKCSGESNQMKNLNE